MGSRVKIALVCEVCDARNYETTRSGEPGAKPLKIKKHCPHCNKHTVHQEAK